LAAVPSTGRADQVDRLAAPEADATRALYETYANQIFGYCLHQLGSREEAEDAVQSTFLNAFRGLKRGVVPEMEAAWLFKIAHNVCLSRRRSSWRRGRIESPADFDVVEEMAPAPSRRSDELIGLQDVLETMPENQRRAILLREWQGLSYHEIADELGLSQSAVETLIFRARRSLASGLEQPPETARKRMRARAGDLGNLLAGIKSMLLGSAAAVKVAATVAVISATTVVAAAPVQSHVHHATPATPSSSTSSGSAGSGLVQAPTPVFQAETTSVAGHGRGGAGHTSVGLPATTSFGLPAVADGTTTPPDGQTATAPSTPASSDPAPTEQPSQPAEQPSQPAPQQSTPPPASNTATTGDTSGQATPVSTPLSQTATPGLSNSSDQSGTQSGTGQSGTGSTGDTSSSGQTTAAPPTTTKNLPVPPIPVSVPVTTSPTPTSPETTNPVTTSPPTSTSGTTQTTSIVVTGGPLSQRVSPGLTTTSGSGTGSGTSSSSSSSGTASTPPALPVPPVSVTTPVTTTTSGSVTGKPKIAPVKSGNP
jgi:RNA polymerase sigma factor (sigma-70 family)